MYKLNIRQKIVLGIAFFTVCFGIIGYLSYSNIGRLEHEVLLVEKTDDLSNLILELRRVEKNYFLYQDPALFSQGFSYIDDAVSVLESINHGVHNSSVQMKTGALAVELSRYREVLQRIGDSIRAGGPAGEDDARQLRELGQGLIEKSRTITALQRASVLLINRSLRDTLLVAMVSVAVVLFMLVLFLSRGILRPLSQVQEATRRIAEGTFTPLEVKNAHDEIQRVFVALNSMVEQLKQRQRQLVQAQKLSSIGTLASGIAHQLNNPLNNIFTSYQILKEQAPCDDPFAQKLMHNIEQETLRARDIVKGLLEFSRNQGFAPAPVPLGDFMQKTIRLVSSQLPSNISLTTEIPEELVLMVDRQRLQEAFLNLLLNAIQAIEPEEGSIRISAERDDAMALINVEDTGSGMSPETMERIFDPFFSTKEVGQGTGLGLYIVYGIIEKHNGRISVSSGPEGGTTFTIRLPLNSPEQDHAA